MKDKTTSTNKAKLNTAFCGVCELDQPKWKVHNELKGVEICKDCVNFIRKLAECNNRDYYEELNFQIDFILNTRNKQKKQQKK